MARITIRLPDALYDRLLVFAAGRSNGQQAELSGIVREALEQHLAPKPRHPVRESVRRLVRHRKSEK